MRKWGWARALGISMACAACHAQVQDDAKLRSDQDDRRWEQPEGEDAPGRSVLRMTPAASGSASVAPSASGALGVTHDLTLAAGAPQAASCGCLVVVAGPAGDPRFSWQAAAVAHATDGWAVAIAPDPACSAQLALMRPSIAGVGREGDDVVLTVEHVRQGTPLMLGALLPPLTPHARLLVRARGVAAHQRPDDSAACTLALQ